MSTTFTTPLMNLTLPVVGVGGQVGPTWASNLNDALQAVDTHNHSSGQGAQIGAAGLNIDADLAFGGFNAVALKSARFTSLASVLASSSDKACVYVKGTDLYYNNTSGVAVQITSGSGINAGSIGGIGGDYATSGASEFYTSATKTFTFTQSSGISAKISVGDVSIYETVASAQGVTLKSPPSLGGSYDLILPAALPASKKIATVTSGGQLAADYDVDNVTLAVTGSALGVIDGSITTAKLADSNVTLSKLVAAVQQALCPVGTVYPYAVPVTAAPAGFLECNGQAVSRTTYAALFSKLGTSYGYGDQSTTFNVPNYVGVFLRGLDTSGSIDPDLFNRIQNPGIFGAAANYTLSVSYVTTSNVGTVASTANMGVGQAMTSTAFAGTAYVVSILSATTFTFSSSATATTTVTTTFASSSSGPFPGSYQVSAFQQHAHTYSYAAASAATNAIIQGTGGNLQVNNTSGTTADAGATTETRPKNVAVRYIIKT